MRRLKPPVASAGRSGREVLRPGVRLSRVHDHATHDRTEAFGTGGVADPRECRVEPWPRVLEMPQVPTACDAALPSNVTYSRVVPTMLGTLVRLAEGKLQKRRSSRSVARPWAEVETILARERRPRASGARYAERRELWEFPSNRCPS